MDGGNFLAMMPLWYAAFLLSLTAHEAAHALAARLGGDDTAYLAGQVSLNPAPHIAREPLGTVVVPLVSFLLNQGGWMMGWASAPYDPAWADRHPNRAAWMAIAGPAANVALAILALAILKGGILVGWWEYESTYAGLDGLVRAEGAIAGAGKFLSIVAWLNLLLAVFNLFPFPPLDGSSVLAGWVPATRPIRAWLMSNPMLSLLGLVVAWRLLGIVFVPFYRAVDAILGG